MLNYLLKQCISTAEPGNSPSVKGLSWAKKFRQNADKGPSETSQQSCSWPGKLEQGLTFFLCPKSLSQWINSFPQERIALRPSVSKMSPDVFPDNFFHWCIFGEIRNHFIIKNSWCYMWKKHIILILVHSDQ